MWQTILNLKIAFFVLFDISCCCFHHVVICSHFLHYVDVCLSTQGFYLIQDF